MAPVTAERGGLTLNSQDMVSTPVGSGLVIDAKTSN